MCELSTGQQWLNALAFGYLFAAAVITFLGGMHIPQLQRYPRHSIVISSLIMTMASPFIWQMVLVTWVAAVKRRPITSKPPAKKL